MSLTIDEMHGLTDRLHRWGISPGPDALRWLAALTAALAVLALSAALQGPAGREVGQIGRIEVLAADGWRPTDLGAMKLEPHQVTILRAQVDLPPKAVAGGPPLALYLSGTFSADAAWNGAFVGSKGRPGASARDEVPGPVDAVLPLPRGVLKVGSNVLTLRLSDERLPVAHSVFHGQGPISGLRVAPYSADARRPIGYYAAPLVTSVVALLGLVWMASKRRLGGPATAVLAGILACALAELSRSIIDYTYPYHAFRMAALNAGAASFGLGCLVLSARAAPSPRAARLRWGVLAAALLAAAALADASQLIVAGALVGGANAAFQAARRRDGALAQQALALLLLAAISRLPQPDFMDQGLYAGALPLIAEILWRLRGGPLQAARSPSPQTVIVGPPNARRFLDPRAVLAIHAAGDNVEIRLGTGRRLVEAQTITGFAARLPGEFFRVHRSHIANLAHAQELRGEGGGRYRLRIGDGVWIPVSRSRIAELRRRLGA